MNIKTYRIAGDDDGLFLAIPHPDHEDYLKIVRVDLAELEVSSVPFPSKDYHQLRESPRHEP